MASTFVCGPFSEIAGAYRAFVRWLEENGTLLDGPDRQSYTAVLGMKRIRGNIDRDPDPGPQRN